MISINNFSEKTIDNNFIIKVINSVLEGEEKLIDLSLAIVSAEEIRKLNNQYRKIDESTDVLSFGEDIMEIVICPEEIEKNGDDFKKELKRVVIHGVLHLLGYTHEESELNAQQMFTKQDKYLKIN